MIKILMIIAVAVIIVFSVFTTFENETGKNHDSHNSLSSAPFLTLTANISDPSPQANFKYGYVSPNLWSFDSGSGDAIMSLFSNGSIHTTAYLRGTVSIFGYPSIHFTQDLPISLQSVYDSNLSSFVSFDIKNASSNVRNDVIYDFFLGVGTTLEYEVEIILFDKAGILNSNTSSNGLVVSIPIQVNKDMKNVSWELNIGTSQSGNFPDYAFTPDISFNTSGNYLISFSPFLRFLQNNSYISSTFSILRLGIGSEFGGSVSPYSAKVLGYDYLSYGFWMYSYFIMNGKEYQVVQPTSNMSSSISPSSVPEVKR